MTKHKRMLDSGNESVCENNFEILTFQPIFDMKTKQFLPFPTPGDDSLTLNLQVTIQFWLQSTQFCASNVFTQ